VCSNKLFFIPHFHFPHTLRQAVPYYVRYVSLATFIRLISISHYILFVNITESGNKVCLCLVLVSTLLRSPVMLIVVLGQDQ